MTKTIALVFGAMLATSGAIAQAEGKVALARKAILALPGVQALRAGQRTPADVDKAMRLHFAGPRAFVASVAEDVDHCVGCERVYIGKIEGSKVSLDLVGPKHRQMVGQKGMSPSTTSFSFFLDEKTNKVMLHGYGGALKPFTLQPDGKLRAGRAFTWELESDFQGATGGYRRVFVRE